MKRITSVKIPLKIAMGENLKINKSSQEEYSDVYTAEVLSALSETVAAEMNTFKRDGSRITENLDFQIQS